MATVFKVQVKSRVWRKPGSQEDVRLGNMDVAIKEVRSLLIRRSATIAGSPPPNFSTVPNVKQFTVHRRTLSTLHHAITGRERFSTSF
jgi:hypothetical protein